MWNAPETDGGSPITDYAIQYSTDDGTTWAAFAHAPIPATPSMATVTGLTWGTTYVFRVAAINAVGTGSFTSKSNSVTTETPIWMPPSVPFNVTATAGDGVVNLTWDSAVPTTPGDSISDYIIQYSTDGTDWTTFTDAQSSNTSVTVNGLANGVPYVFRVTAISIYGGFGSYSVESNQVTLTASASSPSSPFGLFATASGLDQAFLMWNAPETDGGAPITNYAIEYSSDDGMTWLLAAHPATQTPGASVTGLSSGTTYMFRVAAINAVGTGSFSGQSNAVTTEMPPPPTM